MVSRISESDADVILVGKPGVGKTRLLASLADVAFVDPEAADDRLTEDLRSFKPGLLVIDDVEQSRNLPDLIQRIRRHEADWLDMRIVLVCWPDEVDFVRELAPGAIEVALDLLERSDIDAIVQSMGVTAVMARQVIGDQAEGRPGWAVALTDLLLRSRWEEIVTGAALLGQVDGYLRRSQLTDSARDLLAVTSALGGVDDSDLTELAGHVGVSRPTAGRLLRTVAQGGLLDVEDRQSDVGHVRVYRVRPPMLASAIATEHFFGDVPLGDVRDLLDRWPGRVMDLTLTVCAAARLGSDRARSAVDDLVQKFAEDTADPYATCVLTEYLLIDDRSAAKVVHMIQSAVTAPDQDEMKSDPSRLGPIVKLAFLAAACYLDRAAMRLLLDLALVDLRETNPNPEHPLRQLNALCNRLHPDREPTVAHRRLLSVVLDEWMPDSIEGNYWRVWMDVVESMLTPHLRGGFTSPGDARQFTIMKTIVPPDHATELLQEIWPLVLARAPSAPDDVLVRLGAVVHAWLRVGSGYGRPFGKEHGSDVVLRAAEVGRQMFDDLVPAASDKPALIVRLAEMSTMFDVDLPAELDEVVASDPFFRAVDRLDDWETAIGALQPEISAIATRWADEDPPTVVERLLTIRRQNDAAGRAWPNRVGMACESLAGRVTDVRPWLEESLDRGLFPEAGPFVQVVVMTSSEVNRDLLQSCLQQPQSRRVTLAELLTHPPDSNLVDLAIALLDPSDYGILDTLMIRQELSREIRHRILREAAPEVRGVFAIVMSSSKNDPSESIEDEVLDDWLDALMEINVGALEGLAEHYFRCLIPYLAAEFPDTLEGLIFSRIDAADGSSLVSSLGYDIWEAMHVLPAPNKTSLLGKIEKPYVRSFVLQHLVGGDSEWLESLLEADEITLEEALSFTNFHGGIPIDRMAQLLVPRGVDPTRVAMLARWGSWTGPESAHHAELIDQFAKYAESGHDSVSAVGRVGIEMYTQERDAALEREHIKRIRGDL